MIANDEINPYAEIVTGKVELYNGSTLLEVCTCEDVLQDFTVERIEENGKFFGFGVCQKANINLIDIDRVIDVSSADKVIIYFGVEGKYISPYPTFYITEVNRDENTSSISITAYDVLYKASKYALADIGELTEGFTVLDIANDIAGIIGAGGVAIDGVGETETCFYLEGGNFDGAEDMRSILNAIAEVTQTIYFVNFDNDLVFKRLSMEHDGLTIRRDDYYILDSKTNRRLTKLTHATELGDNVTADLGISGSTQFIRNNPFWELREDIHQLLENALAVVGGLTIHQFVMNWRGDFFLEIGDNINIELEDGSLVHSYVLNDVVRYMGYVDEDTQWICEDNENETASNPTTLGDVLKQTTARVDKANQEIMLVAQQAETNTNEIAALTLNTNSVSAFVSSLETQVNENTKQVEELHKSVSATMTEEEITIAINSRFEDGVSKVETDTGFTFNSDGLTISKSDSDITTTITEDGMSVKKDGQAVLTANNGGVSATDLHARTYLIVGNNSRFEDYDYNRTGCFWIGG